MRLCHIFASNYGNNLGILFANEMLRATCLEKGLSSTHFGYLRFFGFMFVLLYKYLNSYRQIEAIYFFLLYRKNCIVRKIIFNFLMPIRCLFSGQRLVNTFKSKLSHKVTLSIDIENSCHFSLSGSKSRKI